MLRELNQLITATLIGTVGFLPTTPAAATEKVVGISCPLRKELRYGPVPSSVAWLRTLGIGGMIAGPLSMGVLFLPVRTWRELWRVEYRISTIKKHLSALESFDWARQDLARREATFQKTLRHFGLEQKWARVPREPLLQIPSDFFNGTRMTATEQAAFREQFQATRWALAEKERTEGVRLVRATEMQKQLNVRVGRLTEVAHCQQLLTREEDKMGQPPLASVRKWRSGVRTFGLGLTILGAGAYFYSENYQESPSLDPETPMTAAEAEAMQEVLRCLADRLGKREEPLEENVDPVVIYRGMSNKLPLMDEDFWWWDIQ